MTLATLIPAFRGSLLFIGIGLLLGLTSSFFILLDKVYPPLELLILNTASARIIHALLDPKGTHWISEEEAVFLFCMSLSLAGGLFFAISYHFPQIHADMCPQIAPLSGETCPGA